MWLVPFILVRTQCCRIMIFMSLCRFSKINHIIYRLIADIVSNESSSSGYAMRSFESEMRYNDRLVLTSLPATTGISVLINVIEGGKLPVLWS